MNKNAYHFTVTQLHGQVAYNIYRFNSWNINTKLSEYIHSLPKSTQGLVEYHDIREKHFAAPTQPFPINDTIGYGVVLGLIWKLTKSLKFQDVQIAQILLFSLSLFLLYQISFMLFGCAQIAYVCCGALILFFPLIAQTVLPLRDIWAYYGTVTLLYGLLTFLYQDSLPKFIISCAFFALCQWVRPAVFLVVLTSICALTVLALASKTYASFTLTPKKYASALLCLLISNAVIFWVPFILYNMHHYNRPFVGPSGQDLVEGLGEFNNPWGYQLSDEWIAQFIHQKYGSLYGTPEFDDDARKEFKQAYAQKPHVFWLNMIKRIPMLIMPALPWIYHKQSPYPNSYSWQEKLVLILKSKKLIYDFFLRHVYIRLFLILGYLGLFFAFRQKNYVALILGLAIIVGGWGKLPSHIEYRYLVPFYWTFALFSGFAAWNFYRYLRDIYFSQKTLLIPRKRSMDL